MKCRLVLLYWTDTKLFICNWFIHFWFDSFLGEPILYSLKIYNKNIKRFAVEIVICHKVLELEDHVVLFVYMFVFNYYFSYVIVLYFEIHVSVENWHFNYNDYDLGNHFNWHRLRLLIWLQILHVSIELIKGHSAVIQAFYLNSLWRNI